MSCPAKSKPHATGTRVGVPSAGWHAPLEISQSGTIVANPRLGRNSRSLHKILDRLASARYHATSDRGQLA